MNRVRVLAIAGKELLEMRRNWMVVLGMAVLPFVFVAIGLFICWRVSVTPDAAQRNLAQFMAPAPLTVLGAKKAYLIFMNDLFAFYLLIVPMILPTLSASYSIVGEKQNRSLEPILSTPITATELIVGKAVAAMSVPVILGWLAHVIYVGGVTAIAGWDVASYLLRPFWILAPLVGGPLVALLTTLVTLILSSRLNDVRAVQAIAASFAVVPFVALSLLMLFKRVYLGLEPLALVLVTLAVLDYGVLRLAVAVFERETILTRWK